jgi:ABC-type transporter Mla subunit MlaD
MATKGSTPRERTNGGDAALDRLGGSLDAAQDALKDLRRELSRGGRDLLKDLDTLLRDARKNLRGARRTLVRDLEEVQKAAAGTRRTAPKRQPAKPTTTTRRSGTASTPKRSGPATRAARKG